ncbi:MAG TPA: SPFH domain-containing protein [Anaerolineae bacterium]
MRARRKPRQRPEPGLLGLILAIMILAFIGFLLADYRRVPFGSLGALVWVGALLFSFTFGLLYFAQYVLPLQGLNGWSEGLRLLWRSQVILAEQYLNRLFAPPATRSRRRQETAQVVPADPRLADLPPSFQILNAGIVRGHQVLAVAKGSGFVRPAGPGFVMLYKGEGVIQVIDLRTYMRKQAVKAHTKDGIPLETDVSVTFRVKQSELDHNDENLLYPYDKDAIFHISYGDSVNAQNRLLLWTEQLAPQAQALLVNELAKYTLNELQQRGQAGTSPLDAIKRDIKQQLDPVADRNGIELISVGVGSLNLPPEVAEQRIKTWQAEWQRKMWSQYATTNAEAARRIKKARARAQVEIIENITHNIESMRRDSNSNLTEIITLRMIEALEEAISEESPVRALIPQQVMANLVLDTSSEMRSWLNRPPEDEQS